MHGMQIVRAFTSARNERNTSPTLITQTLTHLLTLTSPLLTLRQALAAQVSISILTAVKR